MRCVIDTDKKTVSVQGDGQPRELGLYSDEAFELLSDLWLKVGWNQKYSYTFSWLGRPVIQLPEDLVRVQEVFWRIQPDVVVETGVAHGGSLVFHASLCRCVGKGRVVGVDVEIRPASRQAIAEHPLGSLITLVEGDSVAPATVDAVRALIRPEDRVLVILDSNHTRGHVLAELECYQGLVTSGSYLVATDGIMRDLHDVPRGRAEWRDDNPVVAVTEFLKDHPEFVHEQPEWPFRESSLRRNVTHWPYAWLRRL